MTEKASITRAVCDQRVSTHLATVRGTHALWPGVFPLAVAITTPPAVASGLFSARKVTP